jgi:tetratricopeptide (TPR) repeat protein
VYDSAENLFNEGNHAEAARHFNSLEGFSDSRDFYSYIQALISRDEGNYITAIAVFDRLAQNNYKDSAELAQAARQTVYDNAVALFEKKEYTEAVAMFTTIRGFRDTVDFIEYSTVHAMFYAGDYLDAAERFDGLRDYRDSTALAVRARQAAYDAAVDMFERGEYGNAAERFSALGVFNDSRQFSRYSSAHYIITYNEFPESIAIFEELGDFMDSKAMRENTIKMWHNHAMGLFNGDNFIGAITELRTLSDYMDTAEYIDEVRREWSAAQLNTISAQEDVIALLTDGTVVTLFSHGQNTDYPIEDGWYDIVGISRGLQHTAGLRADGTVVIKGDTGVDVSHQSAVYGWTDIVHISAGMTHTAGVKADGTAVAAGRNRMGENDVAEWTDIVAVAAGPSYTLGLKSDGTVVSTDPAHDFLTDWYNINQISARTGAISLLILGLKSDGTVVHNPDAADISFSRPLNWQNVVAVDAGETHFIALRADGSVLVEGPSSHTIASVTEWRDAAAVTAGRMALTLGITANGEILLANTIGFQSNRPRNNADNIAAVSPARRQR